MDDNSILDAALIGLQHHRTAIYAMIAELTRQVEVCGDVAVDMEKPQRKRWKLSAAARKRIAEAQRKRWAALRKAKS